MEAQSTVKAGNNVHPMFYCKVLYSPVRFPPPHCCQFWTTRDISRVVIENGKFRG